MKNINSRIEPLGSGFNFAKMKQAINQNIEATNWLMGMRTSNGYPISEEANGPIIDVRNPPTTQPQVSITTQNFVNTTGGLYPSPTTPNSPVTPPTRTPTLYLTTPDGTLNGLAAGPSLGIQAANSGGTPLVVNWGITVAYEGTVFYTAGGSFTIPAFSGSIITWVLLPETGWTYDPEYLPGYPHGSQQWVYYYNGTPSTSPSPQVMVTPTPGTISMNFGVILMAA
jgi:hypothetical protein